MKNSELLEKCKTTMDDESKKAENLDLKEKLNVKNVESADPENSIDDLICPIADDYSLAILSATRGEGKTVRELSREFEIPIATCYRRVDKLLETPLLDMKEKKLTEDGRRATVFRTGVSFIEISFSLEEKSLNVNIEPVKK